MPNKPVMWDSEAPLELFEGEKQNHNQALRRYHMMGPDRSLRKLAEIFKEEKKKRERGDTSVSYVPTTSFATLANWSAEDDWVNRVIQRDMLDTAAKQYEWKERQEEIRELDWEHGSELRELAWKVIQVAPSFVRRSRKVVDEGSPRVVNMEGEVQREGRPREIVQTVQLSVSDLIKVEEVASKLQRLAAEMDQSRTAVSMDWREEAERAGIPPAQAFETLVTLFADRIQSGSGESDDSGGAEGSTKTDLDE